MRLSCNAIVFDLDGVLVNSAPAIERHWRNWAEAHRVSFQQIMAIAHGMRTVDTIRHVAPHLNAEVEAAQMERLEVIDAVGLSAFRGAAELLRTLPPRSWAIATSGTRQLALARLRHSGLPEPEVLITSDDVDNGKPDPEVYLLSARQMQVAAGRCIAVEDSPAGIQAARAAGMRVIATITTHSASDLKQANAIVAGIWGLRVLIKSEDEKGEGTIEILTVS